MAPAHDVTDRLFVMRRAFRVNDSLPQESASPPHWQWQRGGWLLVDRITGHISPVNLPEFDVFYSEQVGIATMRPIAVSPKMGRKSMLSLRKSAYVSRCLKKPYRWRERGRSETKDASPDSACATPAWQRTPIRVTFEPTGAAKLTFVIHGHIVDLITEEEDEEEPTK